MVRTLVTRRKLSQAPHSFSIVYTGKGRERISTPATLQSLLASGKHSYSWSTRKEGEGVGSRGSCCLQSLAQKHTCTASCSDPLKGNFPKSLSLLGQHCKASSSLIPTATLGPRVFYLSGLWLFSFSPYFLVYVLPSTLAQLQFPLLERKVHTCPRAFALSSLEHPSPGEGSGLFLHFLHRSTASSHS